MTREQLADVFQNRMSTGKGVEVGTYKGEYAKEILARWKGKLYLVDVWFLQDKNVYADMSNQENYKEIFSACMDNIKGNEERCYMLRASSKNAVDLFEDESLDFVYIDANHKYDFVKEDMKLWYPKVRKGGIFAGHDYLKLDWYNDPHFDSNGKDKFIWIDSKDNLNNHNKFAGLFGVNPAVDEFCKENEYEFQVTDEWFGSWFLIK